MMIGIIYPDNFSTVDFDKDTKDIFETLVESAFASEHFNMKTLYNAATLATSPALLSGGPLHSVADWLKKYQLLHNVKFSDFKAGLLDRLLLELGTALGGITFTLTK